MPGFSALASASKSALRFPAFCSFVKGIIISALASDGTAAGGSGKTSLMLSSALRGFFGTRRCLRSRVGLYFDGIVEGRFAPGMNWLGGLFVCWLVGYL